MSRGRGDRWLVAGLLSASLFAGFSPVEGTTLRFENLTNREGLSAPWINWILQDDAGFMWFATGDGLCRFDGYDVTIYRSSPADSSSIADNYVRSLLIDHDGDLWVGTSSGLSRFNRDTETFTTFLPGSYVRHIQQASDSTMWLGSNRGLIHFQAGSTQPQIYTHDREQPASLSNNKVLFTLEDSFGILWVATDGGGLNRLDRTTGDFQAYRNVAGDPRSLSHDIVLCLFEDSTKQLWAGTKNGVSLYDRETDDFVVFRQPRHGIRSHLIYSIAEDQSGHLWFGGLEGLSRLNQSDGEFELVNSAGSENAAQVEGRIRHLFFSQDDNLLWVGSAADGVMIHDPRTATFDHYFHTDDSASLSNNTVLTFMTDSRDRLWVGTDDGLNLLDPTREGFRHYRHDPDNRASLSHNRVTSLAYDGRGHLWVGTGRGLTWYDPAEDRFRRYWREPDRPMALEQLTIRALIGDSAGTVWAGTWGGGLFEFGEDGSLVRHQHDDDDPDSLSQDNVQKLFEDSNGNIWVGTVNAGLDLFDRTERKFRHFRNEEGSPTSLIDNAIFSVQEDSKGRIWIGSRGGLSMLDARLGSITNFGRDIDLSSLIVEGILEDKDGDLWISTSDGLNRFNPETRTVHVFDDRDGLQGRTFVPGSYFKGTDGRLYFGGVNGFSAFRPADVIDNLREPPVVLTELLLLNKPVAIGGAGILDRPIALTDAIVLDHSDYFFALEFSALNYRQSEKNLFAYMLEGLDKEWVYTDSFDRKAVYTTVPHGTYTFRVRGSNDDGVWNDEGRELSITVNPPWWLTLWAKSLLAFFLLTSGPSIFAWRVSQLKKRQLELENQVERKTAEVVLQKEELKEQADDLQEANDRLVELDVFKQGMMGMIVHDLKNPLNSLLNLKPRGSGGDVAELTRQSSRQMLSMVQNILDVQKFEDAKMVLNRKSYCLLDLARRAVLQVDFLSQRKSITVETKIAAELIVGCDSDIVERVFVNLLTNGIKHTPVAGIIEIVAGIDQSGRLVAVEVRDNGEGIPEPHLERIFDKFGQVTVRSSGRVRSTGLGLTFCKLAVETHGGEIGARNGESVGTVFFFTLPAGDSPGQVEPAGDRRAVASVHSEWVLSPEDKEVLEPLMLSMKDLTVYDTSDVENLLDGIEAQHSVGLLRWKQEMEEALHLMNDHTFTILLQQAGL